MSAVPAEKPQGSAVGRRKAAASKRMCKACGRTDHCRITSTKCPYHKSNHPVTCHSCGGSDHRYPTSSKCPHQRKATRCPACGQDDHISPNSTKCSHRRMTAFRMNIAMQRMSRVQEIQRKRKALEVARQPKKIKKVECEKRHLNPGFKTTLIFDYLLRLNDNKGAPLNAEQVREFEGKYGVPIKNVKKHLYRAKQRINLGYEIAMTWGSKPLPHLELSTESKSAERC